MNLLRIFCLALFAATMFFTACGDDDSSSGYVHKNDTSASCGVDDENCECEDDDCDVSSSSKKTAASSSAKEKNDSSSAKSSSSTDAKSSSSVSSSSSGTSAGSSAGGSSSSLKTCPPEKEGNTRTVMETGEKQLCQGGYWVPVSSSSAVPTSSYFDMTNQFNEKVSYGEFTDPRDGHKYRTVDMYDEVFDITYTIFAENLNYGKKILGGAVQGDSTKYCYDDDLWYCENGWGGLYTWSNAMGFPAVCDSVSISAEACSQKFVYPSGHIEPADYVQHQGACPEGWHIMNGGEWAFLSEMSHGDVGYYMGSKVAGFGNKNLYGMSLLPTGYWERYPNGTTVFQNIKEQTLFWLPEQNSDYPDEAKLTNVMDNQTSRGGARKKNDYAHSVRCVKNY